MTQAYISEIFCSIQGEGPFTGERQIFVRLAGCPLRCDYCDTPESLTTQGHPQLTVEQVVDRVTGISQHESVSTVSVTGGEPLAHLAFLQELLPRLKEKNLKIYLETAGVHPEALKRVIDNVDVVSMDIKLPSATGKEFWSEHEEFLKVSGKKAFVKMVVEKHSTDSEVKQAVALASRQTPPPTFVIQWVTPIGTIQPPALEQINSFLALAKNQLPDVRVMHQQHKIWGIR